MHALQVLEFDAVRARLAAHAETGLGGEIAARLEPAWHADAVTERVEETAEAHDALARLSPPSLAGVRDLRSPLRRAGKGGVLGGQELYAVLDALAGMRAMRNFLAPQEAMVRLRPMAEALPELPRIESDLRDALEPDGSLKDEASPQLAILRGRKRSTAARIQERIQSYLSGPYRTLLSDMVYTVRDGRYVLPLKAENRGKLRGVVHDVSSTGATIYVEPEDVLQLGNALRETEGLERQEELRILTSLSARVGVHADEITGGIEVAGRIDLIFARARYAYEVRGARPEIVPGPARVEIQAGKHPLLDPDVVVPLDLRVGVGASVLITGPNTGGKTVGMKTTGLFVLMAQCGMYPPALGLRLSPFRQVWADIGDEQSLEQSLSTFSGHIRNIAQAMKWLKPGALVLFDELGAGTDPAEGAALAVAILRDLASRGAAILASTHYGELKAFAYEEEGFENAAMEFDAKTLRPTYRLRMGTPGASQALRIAERYGIPGDIVEHAREQLGRQAQDLARMMEELEAAQRRARQAQSEADRRAADLRKEEKRTQRKLEEADEIRRTAHAKANEVIEAALREIRLEADRLFEEIKKGPEGRDQARRGLRELDEAGRDLAAQFAPRARPGEGPREWKRGDRAKVAGLGGVATLLEEPKNGKVSVQAGSLRMTVAVSQLEATGEKEKVARPNATSMRLARAATQATEFLMLGKRAEEAERELAEFVDSAVLAGVPQVRIVHGKGEGILRRMTQDLLKVHPSVAEYRDGDATEGGSGVTIAVFG